MPQKRNPDAAELVRGHAGRIARRDDRALRDDEGSAARLFEGHAGRQAAGVRGARSAHPLARGDGRDGRDRRPSTRTRMRAAAEAGHATATDLADWLVREARRAVPRGAPHHRPGGAARRRARACRSGRCLSTRSARSTRGSAPAFSMCFRPTLRLRAGPATAAPRPSQVRKRIEAAKKALGMNE